MGLEERREQLTSEMSGGTSPGLAVEAEGGTGGAVPEEIFL